MTVPPTQGDGDSGRGRLAVRAAWVCPIDRAPIRHGWIALEAGRIAAFGSPTDIIPPGIDRIHDLGRVAILPALVNAHTHLELSWLRDRVPPAASFTAWVLQLIATRGGRSERIDDGRVLEAARTAAREAHRAGTIAVGDISNSLASIGPMGDVGLHGIVFHELLGFADATGQRVADTRSVRAGVLAPPGIQVGLAPHAPYSVSAELFRAIRDEVDRGALPITSVHLGEAPEEIEMLARGTGSWPGMLRTIGAWREGWVAPGIGPVEYLDDLGFLDRRTLVVHGVQLGDASLARLAERECTLVTCPRSNKWVGVGAPPIGRFYASGVAVAVGTDSLASAPDLNLFAELAEMRWLAPHIPARRLLESATLVGARALGLGDAFGTISAGKCAALITVAVPSGIEDVEEYLVSGIEPRQVEWV